MLTRAGILGAAGKAPSWPMAGAVLDYDFTTPQYYAGSKLAAFSNAVTLTRSGANATDLLSIDPAGTPYNTYAANAPRFKNGGLMIEGIDVQKSAHSTAPVNETITLGVGKYCIWVNGTGSAAIAAGTAVGTGFGSATEQNPLNINLSTGGTITTTITGSLSALQVENQQAGIATSLITSGMRGQEAPALAATPMGHITFPCTILMEVEFPQIQNLLNLSVFGDANAPQRTLFSLYQDASNYLQGYLFSSPNGSVIAVQGVIGGATTLNFVSLGSTFFGFIEAPSIYRFAIRLNSGNSSAQSSNNTTMVYSATATAYPTLASVYLGTLDAAGDNILSAMVRRFIVQPSMSDAAMQTWLAGCPGQSNVITTWGDSLTYGNGASVPGMTGYPEVCAALFGIKQRVINSGKSGDTSQNVATRQTADIVAVSGINVFWTGRNNITGSLTTDQSGVMTSTASMVAHQTSGKFIVLGITSRYNGTEDTGSAIYNEIIAINSALAAAYPSNYIDVLSLGVTASGGSNGHINSTWGNGDGLHYNDTMYAWLGGVVHSFIHSNGWL